uniref:Secreted protein n=1 Tax=Ixodes ricinus TaxID=34613 RepID=A0A6B0U5F5_IXORI
MIWLRMAGLTSRWISFLAMTSPLGRCSTLVTTPPLPAPSSPRFSKSSLLSSPTFCFCERKASRRLRCCSSSSRPSSVFWSASMLVSSVDLSLFVSHPA